MNNGENSDRKGFQQQQIIAEEISADTMKQKFIKAKDIARKLKSFDHFIYVWGEKGRYYLPPKNTLTWHYISQILAKEKRLLKLDEVGHQIEVPKVRGKVVNEMFDEVKHVNGLHFYFPDFSESHSVPRDYFFNVIITRY